MHNISFQYRSSSVARHTRRHVCETHKKTCCTLHKTSTCTSAHNHATRRNESQLREERGRIDCEKDKRACSRAVQVTRELRLKVESNKVVAQVNSIDVSSNALVHRDRVPHSPSGRRAVQHEVVAAAVFLRFLRKRVGCWPTGHSEEELFTAVCRDCRSENALVVGIPQPPKSIVSRKVETVVDTRRLHSWHWCDDGCLPFGGRRRRQRRRRWSAHVSCVQVDVMFAKRRHAALESSRHRRNHRPAPAAVDAAVHVAAGVAPEPIVPRHQDPACGVLCRWHHHSMSVRWSQSVDRRK
jgi:hypothetical protein